MKGAGLEDDIIESFLQQRKIQNTPSSASPPPSSSSSTTTKKKTKEEEELEKKLSEFRKFPSSMPDQVLKMRMKGAGLEDDIIESFLQQRKIQNTPSSAPPPSSSSTTTTKKKNKRRRGIGKKAL